jgi:outer membrane protein assembly factor BamB
MPPHQRRRGQGPKRPRTTSRDGAEKAEPRRRRDQRGNAGHPRATAPAVSPLGPRRSVGRALVIAAGAIVAMALLGAGLFVVVRGGGGSSSCDPDANGWNGAGAGPRQTDASPVSIHDPAKGWAPTWHYPAQGAPAADRVVAPPSAAGGSVYTATEDGTLVALDAAKGTRQWTSAPAQAEQGVVQTPIALDGCGAVLATSFPGSQGQPAGALRAVDLRTHQRRWGVQAADEIFSAPEIVDGVSYQGLSFPATTGALDRIHVLDGYYVNDGSRGYRKRFTAAVFAAPSSDHQRIWIGDLDQNLYALGPGGKQLWTYTTGGIITLPAMDDGSSVIVAGADHHVAALDPASGREKWNVEVGEVQAAMAVGNGEVLVADVDGTVRALSSADGTERWHHDLGAHVSRAVVSAGDRVFVVDDDGGLHVLDAGNGNETATWTAPAPPTGPPAIAAGHLYITCQDGRLYALPL